MAHIPHGYLKKDGGKWRSIRLTDIVTLLYNVCQGAREEKVGWEDAHRTVSQIVQRLNNRVLIDPAVLESALWSCNLMNENEMFWDTRSRNFETFLKDVLGRDRFHLVYNTIETKEKK